ncbi:MAG: hypothetical protein C9356_12130 [Oleiphilus sp.]|nr:MAG: hypothetical protein C9356_12130 [Oleiphilus sp.]
MNSACGESCFRAITKNCGRSIIEYHEGFDLAFLEFSERGNLFSGKHTTDVMNHIKRHANEGPIALMVYVHGWKHNAHPHNSDVAGFRLSLKNLKDSGLANGRKIIGVFVGWRGFSHDMFGLAPFTYWDRKSVAEEVGAGGVTDVLMQLDRIDKQPYAWQKDIDKNNTLLIVGHSFGAAITLSAINDVLIRNLNESEATLDDVQQIGDAVVLVNPAIEANAIFQLKESSMRIGARTPNKLRALHILSSSADWATHFAFPLGESISGLLWNHTDIEREYFGEKYVFSEGKLDRTTIGNYDRFWTGRFVDKHPKESFLMRTFNKVDTFLTKKRDDEALIGDGEEIADWKYESYCDGQHKRDGVHRVPCAEGEPLSFVYTPKSFICGHNDIFNVNVLAYLATLMSESDLKQRHWDRDLTPDEEASVKGMLARACKSPAGFKFGECFRFHRMIFEQSRDVADWDDLKLLR